MAGKNTIPSYDKNQQLEALRAGLTNDVPDPTAAKDEINSNAWKLQDEKTPYSQKYLD